MTSILSAEARKYQPEEKNGWYGTIQVGRSLAFGDDSWHVFKDYKEAKGVAASLSIGKAFNPLFGGQVKARYLEMKNRVNLEVYETFKDKYPEYFHIGGFYNYKGIALEAEATLNVTNLIKRNRTWDFFNLYLIAGGGANLTYWYDETVDYWDGSINPGLSYPVDKRCHVMPVGVVGGLLDFRVDNDLSLNLEVLGSFTGDLMDGVKYEEGYDVYITISLGATVYF